MRQSTKAARRLRVVRQRAETIAKDSAAASRLIDDAWRKAERTGDRLDRLRDDFFALMRLTRAGISGRYAKIPWTSLVSATAAIVYFLNPLDAVPDFLVGVGLLDDATVIALVLRAIQGDLRAFQRWESRHGEAAPHGDKVDAADDDDDDDEADEEPI